MFIISEYWKKTYPDAKIAVLILRNVENKKEDKELEKRKRELENELGARFEDESDLKALKPAQAYAAYYKRFKKTYPLMQQLKTLVFKKKPLPVVSALVDAMFMAEMKNLLLTAGHDLEKLFLPITIDISQGTESYIKLNGEAQSLKPDDMIMTDQEGVISSVLYGPDQRTRITTYTRNALFVVYAPGGIAKEDLCRHLRDMEENVLIFSPFIDTGPAKIFSVHGEEVVVL